jgi:hypothetical protein
MGAETRRRAVKQEWEWVARRLPPMPKYRSVRQSMTLSKKTLAEECWAARVNSECSAPLTAGSA